MVTTPAPLPTDLGLLLRHLEQAAPNEGCGVILTGPGGHTLVPMENAYDRYRAVDPEGFPRTARTAYFFDPREWMRVLARAESEGAVVSCIVHSHVEVGAYFSAEDRAMAAPDGQPLFPGVSYLVVAVDQGRATVARLFWWEGDTFQERDVPLTA